MKNITPTKIIFSLFCFFNFLLASIFAEATARIQWNHQWPGKFRKMEAEFFVSMPQLRANSQHEVIVITPGIIENSKWYSNPKAALPLTEFFTSAGFDVLALSFPPVNEAELKKTKVADASFREIVTLHLPSIGQMIKQRGWQKVHWLGHSYGSTLTTAYLLGYQAKPSTDGYSEFVMDPLLSKQRQAQTASFITVSGLFKLYWPINYWDFWNPLNFTSDNLFRASPLVQYIIEKLPLRMMNFLKPVVGFNWLKLFSEFGFPFTAPDWLPLRDYSMLVNPIFYPANATDEGLKYAMENGLSEESFETISTISSLYHWPERLRWPSSRALRFFNQDLSKLTVPTLFVVGDRDLITHHEGIKKFGYDLIGSDTKSFVLLPETGHQDILISKHPEKLTGAFAHWFTKLATRPE